MSRAAALALLALSAGAPAAVADSSATTTTTATAATTTTATTTATATAATAATATDAPPSKKDQYLADKAAARTSKRRRPAVRLIPGKPAEPVIALHNTWTNEWMALDRDDKKSPPRALFDRFLRCHYTDQATSMQPALVAFLRDAASHFSARRIEIVSGFRSPKYNLMLRKKGHEVASESQHTKGHAVDFRIPGVDVLDLEKWARDHRKGGVGLYRESQFVHMDNGPVRRWEGT